MGAMTFGALTLRKLACLAVIALTILIDQISKWVMTELVFRPMSGEKSINFFTWITDAPERLGPAKAESLPFYNLVMVWNEGVSFGLFNQGGVPESMPLILSGFALALSFGFILWMLATKDRLTALALALIVGGALSNVIDRLRFGAVIDFVDVHIAGYHWPAFNLADSCIVLGVAALLLGSLFFEKKASSRP